MADLGIDFNQPEGAVDDEVLALLSPMLENLKAVLRASILDLNSQIYEATAAAKRAHTQRIDAGEQLAAAQTHLANTKHRSDVAADKLTVVSATIAQGKQAIILLNEELEAAEAAKVASAAQETALRREAAALTATIRQLLTQAETAAADAEVQRARVARGEQVLTQEEAQTMARDLRILALERTIDDLRTRQARLTAEIAARQPDTEAAKTLLAAAEDEIKSVGTEIGRLTNDLAAAERTLEAQAKEAWKQSEAGNAARSEASVLDREVQNAITRYQKAREAADVAARERFSLQARRAVAERRLADLQSQRDDALTKIGALNAQRSDLMAETEQLQRARRRVESEVAAVQRKLEAVSSVTRTVEVSADNVDIEGRAAFRNVSSHLAERKALLAQEVQLGRRISEAENSLALIELDRLAVVETNNALEEAANAISAQIKAENDAISQQEDKCAQLERKMVARAMQLDRISREVAAEMRKTGDTAPVSADQRILENLTQALAQAQAETRQRELLWMNRQRVCADAERRLAKTRAEAAVRADQRSVLESKIRGADRTLASIQGETMIVERRITSMQSAIARISSEIAAKNALAEQARQRGAVAVDRAVEAAADVEHRAAAASRTAAALQADIDGCQTELMASERRVALLQRKVALASEMLRVMDPQAGQQELRAMRGEVHAMELRLDALKLEQVQLMEQMSKAIARWNDARQAGQVRPDPRAAEQRRAALVAPPQAGRGGLVAGVAAQVTRQEAEITRRQLQNQIDSSEDDLRTVEMEIDRLQAQLQTAEQDALSLNDGITGARNEISDAEQTAQHIQMAALLSRAVALRAQTDQVALLNAEANNIDLNIENPDELPAVKAQDEAQAAKLRTIVRRLSEWHGARVGVENMVTIEAEVTNPAELLNELRMRYK